MKRQPRVAALRLVLEDRRVDECLAKLKALDMVLVEMEDKIGRLEDAVRVWRIQCDQRHKEPQLPLGGEGLLVDG